MNLDHLRILQKIVIPQKSMLYILQLINYLPLPNITLSFNPNVNHISELRVPVCDSCKKPSQGSLAQEEISIPDLLTLFSMKNSQQQSLLCIQKSSWNDEPFT
ncbi:hypothetical protein RIR_jg39046.t1 [Rhizophagus irregularis DAOM 181602=DAOM 197198]|nr:hypothetical protein RIR_jg39046.t1 [Rhizophagus irregularis DAOM 181602=DAOM 197198]